MTHEHSNSHLLLGLAIGALAGATAGYLVAVNRKKIIDELKHVMDEVKDGARHAVSKAKLRAEEAGGEMAENVSERAEHFRAKMEEKNAANK